MVKSRRNVILALIMILVMSMSVLLVACNPDNGGNNDNKNPAAFTVTFLQPDANGTWVEYKKVTSVDGAITAPANPTKTNYSFVGWYKEKELTNKVDDVAALKATATLYAKFAKVNFEVKFMNGETLVSTVTSVGNNVELPANPEAPEGKVFAGWYKDATLENKFTNGEVTADMTLYAKFNDVNTTYPDCDVKLMAGDTQIGEILKSHYGVVELPNPKKDNWMFMGWFTDEAFENEFVNGSIQVSTTLYAKFVQVNFTINFMTMVDGEWTVLETKVSDKNAIVAPVIEDKKGYEFKGWFTDTEFTADKAFEPNNVTADATVYANIIKLKGKNVTFMIPNGTEWKEYKVVESDSATDKIELPANPFVKYKTFKGWYLEDKDFATKFEGTETIEKAMTVYANCVAKEVTVHFDKKDMGKMDISLIEKNFNQTVAEGKAIDGWYTNEICTVKWNGVDDTQNLYARTSVAITFNNGYEDIYTGAVVDGKFANPHDTIIKMYGEEKTLESMMIKDYMSDRDISYLDEAGKPFDFSQKIEKATTVTVRWNSKIGESNYKKNDKTGNYYIEPSSLPNAPVISLLSEVTIMLPESDAADAPKVPTKITVEAFTAYSDIVGDQVKKIMIGEGFVSIKGISGDSTCVVDTIELPSSLKIIDGCFNNMSKLKGVTIPDGVEVIIGSFFNKTLQDYKTYYLGVPYDFEIAIPASVKNMAHVPNNFTFDKFSSFYKDGGYIYQNAERGKVLISDPAAYAKFDKQGHAYADTIVVPEGVEGIQVGTYNLWFNYLKLPSTFKFVNYNANASDYPAYRGMEGSSMSFSSIMLFDENAIEAPSAFMSPQAYTIATCLGGARVGMNPDWSAIFGYGGKVVFATETVPVGLNGFAFAGDATGFAVMNGRYQKMTDKALQDSIILKDAANQVYITSTYNNAASANLVLTDVARLDAETVKADMIAKFPANLQTEIAAAKSIKFYANNEEIALGDVTGDMFITMVIVPPSKLFINTNWQVGYTGSGYSAKDYENPAAATKFHKGDFEIVKIDIAGMTADSIKAEIKKHALAEAMTDWYVETFATEVNAKAYLEYFYTNATVEFKVGGKVVDPATITLEKGDVTLDVVWTLPAKA